MTAYELVPTFSRIRVLLDGDVVADTREARIALGEGKSPFYLVPKMDLHAELVAAEGTSDDGGTLHEIRVHGGRTLEQRAVTYAAHPDLVRIDPLDLRSNRAAWDEKPELTWREENRAGMPFARSPRHRVDVIPLSEPARIEVDGQVVAKSEAASLVLEAPLPPRIYVPEVDWVEGVLQPVEGGRTVCPYKGVANYFDLSVGGKTQSRVVWGYDREAAPQNWLLPSLDRLRAVIPSGSIQVFVGKTRVPLP